MRPAPPASSPTCPWSQRPRKSRSYRSANALVDCERTRLRAEGYELAGDHRGAAVAIFNIRGLMPLPGTAAKFR
jgi:hypothetical protein